MEKHESKIPFLDVLVYKEGRKLHTDIFYKKTDTQISELKFLPSKTH